MRARTTWINSLSLLLSVGLLLLYYCYEVFSGLFYSKGALQLVENQQREGTKQSDIAFAGKIDEARRRFLHALYSTPSSPSFDTRLLFHPRF